MFRPILSLILAATAAFSIGPQHGVFESRSTQGTEWHGSSSIITEHYAITVMPSYLDVELDLEFDCSGTEPDSFKNALEIVGNMNLAQDAAVSGMLLWNGEEILKAKLKPIRQAREEYEEVVDRDAVAPKIPRDPVIFEYGWGKDNYFISIFPVTWQSSRKLRMRYVIPAANIYGTADIPFPGAFNPSVATYKIICGPGVDAFGAVTRSGELEKMGSTEEFNTGSGIYAKINLIRPLIPDTDGSSVIYSADINLDGLSGSLSHVIGQTGAEILEKIPLKKDYVILWRWNHPEYAHVYRKQIVRQAELIKEFLDRLSDSNKRAALIVDRTGGDRTIFELGGSDSDIFSSMVAFVDSLSRLDYIDEQKPFTPDFTRQEIDSIIALSMEEFEGAIRAAMAMFDDRPNTITIRRIVLLTAGPAWITQYDNTFTFTPEDDIGITTFALMHGSELPSEIPFPQEAKSFYWPGISQYKVVRAQSPYTLEAVVSSEDGASITVPVSAEPHAPTYSWSYTSSHLNAKVHSVGRLLPEVTWRISQNGNPVAEFIEEVNVVPMSDPLQFGNSLAGTGTLQSIDGTLPRSLAGTFGFVDPEYALLALEEDVMQDDEQERYRLSGVPPLTEADIIPFTDEPAAPQEHLVDDQPATPVEKKSVADPAQRFSPVICLRQSMLAVSFIGTSYEGAAKATVGIYTLSGRLLRLFKDRRMLGGMLHLDLAGVLHIPEQALIVTVKVEGATFTRMLMLR